MWMITGKQLPRSTWHDLTRFSFREFDWIPPSWRCLGGPILTRFG